jgi:EAL domain-containing protein (putative c-di-GMP-specific phosphodiesterase class I)/CheY-like chemotaxis protein
MVMTPKPRSAASERCLAHARPSSARPGPVVSTSPPSSEGRPVRLLLVDDDPLIVSTFRRLLEASGLVVDVARDGLQALELFTERRYDAVLSDVSMPQLDGLELLRELRGRDPDVPVIIMTGGPTTSTAARALQYGALEYLVKPIEVDDLVRAVTRATRLHRMTLAERRAGDLLRRSGTNRTGLLATFDSALRGIWMAFQPIVSVRERRVIAYESLMRSTEAALPSPGAMLDAAEKLNRLDQLGRVTRERTALAAAGAPGQMVFVNLHPKDLFDPDLLEPTSALAKISERVVLEVTERASLDVGEHVKDRIAALRSAGYRIAIDDLGAGYAGLSTFAQLEPEVVKLDMSLVRDVHQHRTKQKLVRSMVHLAREMGTMVIAEGIESEVERDVLSDIGCDLMQGFLFARPGAPFPGVPF